MFNKNKKKQSLGRVGRVEREQRYNRMIRITTIAIVSLVVAIALGGILYNSVYLPSTPIVTIDGEEILTKEFQKRAKLERFQLMQSYNGMLTNYQQYQSFMQSVTDVNQQQQIITLLQQLESQMQQIDFQLGPDNKDSIGQTVINQMIDEKFIVEEAESRGITVTDEEVETFLQEIYGYYPDGVPTLAPTDAPLPTSTLSPTQLAMITPTPAPTTADDDESPEPTEEIALDQPLPTSVTEDEYNTSKSQYFDALSEIGIDEAFFKELIRLQLYRDKLNLELSQGITPPTQEQVWARHILVEDLETAEDLLQQLEEGGDFGDLAREFSTGPSVVSGGDLGWFGRGQMVADFEEAAFGGEIGDIVGPVETQFGFHLIQIVGKEERPAPASEMDQLVFAALTDLLNQYKEEADIVFAENFLNRTPTEPDIIRLADQPQAPVQP